MGLFSRQTPKVRAAKARLYELIERATSEYLSAPNYALNTDVVNAINSAPDPGYMGGKACKRLKLRIGAKNPRVLALALQLLENCVRSCGEAFHAQLARSELLPELLRMADRSSWCPPQAQAQVLALLQEWAYALRPAPFINGYNTLKRRGLPFPPHDGTGAAAPGSVEQFAPYPGLSPPPPGEEHAPPPGSGRVPPLPLGGGGPPPGEPHPSVGGPQLLSARQPTSKVLADIEVARNTVNLLNELLDGVPPEDPAAARAEYITEMVESAQLMKSRLARLVEASNDEAVVAAALSLNDEAQQALDRHAAMAGGRPRRRRSGEPRARTEAEAEAEAAPVVWPAAAPAPQPASPPPLIGDLLSLDDTWSAPAGGEAGAPVDPFAPLAHGGGGSGAPTPLAPRPYVPVNNPFAAGPPPPAAVAPRPAPSPYAQAESSAPSLAVVPGDAFFNDAAFAAVPGGGFGAAPSGDLAAAPSGGFSAPPPAAAARPATGNPFAAPAAEPVAIPAVSAPPAGLATPPRASPLAVSPQPFAASPGAYPLHTPMPTPAGSAPRAGLTGSYGSPLDAFGDLVRVETRKEEPPPPPRGAPMRGGSASLDLRPANGKAEASTGAPATPAGGLGAFDAFDELATHRSGTQPSPTP